MLSQLTQRAVIVAQTLAPAGGGGYSASWSTVANVWASIEPISGADVFGPDASESRARYRIVLRRRTDVIAGMRVRIENRAFVIRAVLDDGPLSQFMTLLTEELA